MPSPSPSMSPMLEAAAIQQRIAATAAAVRKRKTSPIAAKGGPHSRVEISPAEKKVARLSKQLNKTRLLLEKVAAGARGFHEVRKKETTSLHPNRRWGRKHSDKILARLFLRIDQMQQAAQAEKEAPQNPAPRGS